MGDELKAGSLILSLGLFLSCYLIENKNYKNIGIILIFFCFRQFLFLVIDPIL